MDPEKVKEIAELPVNDSGYSEDDDGATAIALAAWMKRRYGSTMAAALRTVLTSRKPGKPVKTREIELALSREEALRQLEVYVRKHQVARERLLRELMEVPRQPYSLITGKLHITAPVIRAMSSAGVIRVTEEESFRNPVLFDKADEDRKELSEAQKAIVDGVLADFDEGKSTVSLIHGITGSGKTEVYISIIKGIVDRGRKAIMLIPEIALTYQTLLRFYRYFGERVSVMNSSLSDSEKADQWERARRGEIDVIIGPRSALFTPFAQLGVIVIDEEHEGSYKNESMPKYHTREVAEELARLRREARSRLWRSPICGRNSETETDRSCRSGCSSFLKTVSSGESSPFSFSTGAAWRGSYPAGPADRSSSALTATSRCPCTKITGWSATTAAMSSRE